MPKKTATATPEKERRTVRVDISTLSVYPSAGQGLNRIGAVLTFTTNEGARTPSGGKFVSRRLTVRLRDDERDWVGQFSNEEWNRKTPLKAVILRLKDDEETAE